MLPEPVNVHIFYGTVWVDLTECCNSAMTFIMPMKYHMPRLLREDMSPVRYSDLCREDFSTTLIPTMAMLNSGKILESVVLTAVDRETFYAFHHSGMQGK